MLIVQLILYCLLFTAMVRYSVRGEAINGLYFYPKAVQERAYEIGLTDRETVKKQRKQFMTLFYIVMLTALVLIILIWNHVSDFKTAYLQALLFLEVMNIYDGIVIDFVPHEWLFRHVKGVVHHGGAGTTSAGLRAGCPTFVLAFGGDQLFWGLQVAERNLGPAPVDIHSGKWTEEQIIQGLLKLKNGIYADSARKLGEHLRQEHGCKNAADVLESLI